MSLGNLLLKFWDNVILQRTGFKANYNGIIISGCGDCGDNREFPGLLPYAPTHRCIADVDSTGQNPMILDPYNIPPTCPRRIVESDKK